MTDRRKRKKRVNVPLRAALVMIGGYTWRRVREQIRSVLFIIVYLFAFQTLILRASPGDALPLAVGIALVVAGLTLFLEGVLLGLMPLGEKVGITLPSRCGITVILVFGMVVGIGATLAEPAISILRTAGAAVTPWDAPLLYVLLERYTDRLVISIAIGVGVAVAIGVSRFYYGFSLKPIIFIIVPILLALTAVYHFDPNLSTIIGLAWDSGAVTTGPVTVPLILAVGIGVSRATGRNGAGNSFGVIMLASALPVLAVLILGAVINGGLPGPTTAEEFFSPAYRTEALRVVESEDALRRVEALRAPTPDAEEPELPRELSPTEVLRAETLPAARAIIPLTAVLFLVLVVFLREHPRYYDEVIFGIVIAVIGMILLTSGIRLGLAPLGENVGRQLPRAFRPVDQDLSRIVIDDFDLELLQESVGSDGARRSFFYLYESEGPRPVVFDPTRFDPRTGRYEHVVRRPPLFGPNLTLLGLGLVFLFAFGMGYGSTLAEPALNALGRTVEDLTVGTVKRAGVIRAVSIGVGTGLMLGVARILYNAPMAWLLIPSYLLLAILTIWSDEDFTGIAWDSGGVTTGPVTVPLVLAMGLAIGGEVNVIDGFGVLAMASVMPNIMVMLYGYIIRSRQQRMIRMTDTGGGDE
ncbi:MAG: DUF1538 domain-containing protein [Spirochaetaceae bacterium]|nr:MAG: DUF1538 domain-containing protein [Spirochaetaceae bacterium]